MTPSYRFGCLRIVADPIRPVEGVDHKHVHAGFGDVLRREVAGGVGGHRAVVVGLVLDVVYQHHQGVAARPVLADRRADVAVVRLVDSDDVAGKLIA